MHLTQTKKIEDFQGRYPFFPIITSGSSQSRLPYLGGNQEWFKESGNYTAAYGGCGPVAAANILAALARENLTFAKQINHPNWHAQDTIEKAEYLSFMESIYETVTPFEIYRAKESRNFLSSFGVFSSRHFKQRTVKYASGRGLSLKAVDYKIEDFEKIKTALDKNNYLAFLNTWTKIPLYRPDGSLATKYNRHWVTLIGCNENRIAVSSWGKEYFINYNDLLQGCALLRRWNHIIGFEIQ